MMPARTLKGGPPEGSHGLEALYVAHAARIFGLALRLVGRVDAEEILQAAFLTAHRDPEGPPAGVGRGDWLFGVAVSLCLTRLQDRSRRNQWFPDLIQEDLAHEATSGPMIGTVDRLDLERALGTLPPQARVVFVLHDIEGIEHAQITALTGMHDALSRAQLHKARLHLRRVLAGPGGLRHRS